MSSSKYLAIKDIARGIIEGSRLKAELEIEGFFSLSILLFIDEGVWDIRAIEDDTKSTPKAWFL